MWSLADVDKASSVLPKPSWESGPVLLFRTWPLANPQMRENKISITIIGLLQMPKQLERLSAHSLQQNEPVKLIARNETDAWKCLLKSCLRQRWHKRGNNVCIELITYFLLGSMSFPRVLR